MLNPPLMTFNLDKIQSRLEILDQFRKRFGINFLFPIKAFPEPRVLELVARKLQGFEIGNLNELDLLPRNIDKAMIWINSPHSFSGFDGLDSHKNLSIFRSIDHLVDDGPIDESQIFRINIQSVLPSELKSRFGVDLARLKGFKIKGLHIHFSRQDTQLGHFTHLIDHLKTAVETLDSPIEILNFGGSLTWLELDQMEYLCRYARQSFPFAKIFFEPGRWISSAAGQIRGEVIDILENQKANQISVWTNISKICHLQWSFPKLMIPPGGSSGQSTELVIYGPSQHEQDIIGKFVMPEWQASDLSNFFRQQRTLIFANVCGYSWSFNCTFNGIPQAKVEFRQQKVSTQSLYDDTRIHS